MVPAVDAEVASEACNTPITATASRAWVSKCCSVLHVYTQFVFDEQTNTNKALHIAHRTNGAYQRDFLLALVICRNAIIFRRSRMSCAVTHSQPHSPVCHGVAANLRCTHACDMCYCMWLQLPCPPLAGQATPLSAGQVSHFKLLSFVHPSPSPLTSFEYLCTLLPSVSVLPFRVCQQNIEFPDRRVCRMCWYPMSSLTNCLCVCECDCDCASACLLVFSNSLC